MHLLTVISLGFFAAFASHARAESYRFGASELRLTVRHPFKVVTFTAKKISGKLEADPESRRGDLEAVIPAKSVMASEAGAQAYFSRLIKKDEGIHFSAKEIQILRPTSAEEDKRNWNVRAVGELTIFGTTAAQTLDLDCAEEASYISCAVKGLIHLDRVGIPTPQLLWVRGSNIVEVEGELTFAPEGDR